MFGRQASSPSRTGTLLLLMVALVTGVRLTESTSMASDNVGGWMVKNGSSSFAFSNLTGRGLSMLRSFDAPPKGLGITDVTMMSFPTGNGSNSDVVYPHYQVPECANPSLTKANECYDSYKKPTKRGKELCTYWNDVSQCVLDGVCAYCTKVEIDLVADVMLKLFELAKVCDKPEKLSCSSNLLWIILAVVGGVIVVIVVIGVVVCCCCMGGGGKRKHSKHSSKRSSKSKLRKGSSKHRGSSRH